MKSQIFLVKCQFSQGFPWLFADWGSHPISMAPHLAHPAPAAQSRRRARAAATPALGEAAPQAAPSSAPRVPQRRPWDGPGGSRRAAPTRGQGLAGMAGLNQKTWGKNAIFLGKKNIQIPPIPLQCGGEGARVSAPPFQFRRFMTLSTCHHLAQSRHYTTAETVGSVPLDHFRELVAEQLCYRRWHAAPPQKPMSALQLPICQLSAMEALQLLSPLLLSCDCSWNLRGDRQQWQPYWVKHGKTFTFGGTGRV